MAEIDYFDEIKTKWFEFGGDSEVLLKFTNRESLTKIGEKAAEIARKSGVPSDQTINRLLGRYAVLGWRKKADHSHPGLTMGGQPVEYNPQNVDRLMKISTQFAIFVNRHCIDAAAFRTPEEVNIDEIAAELFGADASDAGADDSKNG